MCPGEWRPTGAKHPGDSAGLRGEFSRPLNWHFNVKIFPLAAPLSCGSAGWATPATWKGHNACLASVLHLC